MRRFTARFLLMLCLLGCTEIPSGAAQAKLLSLRAEQAGDSMILLFLEGASLTKPEIVLQNSDSVILALRGVSFPAVRHERSLDTPLAPYVVIEQSGDDVLVTLTCDSPLKIRGVKGIATGKMRIQIVKDLPSDLSETRRGMEERKRGDPLQSVKKISLELKNCTFAEAFRLLGAYAEVNVIVDGSVPKDRTLTLSLRDAPLAEAFQFVLRSGNLDYGIIGRTVVIGARNALSVLMDRAVTMVYPVAYAEPQKIVPLLREMADLTSPANSIIVDERLRELYVKATPMQQERTRKTLQRIDAPGRQVMMKARIIEVNDDASDQLETAINAVYDWWWGSFQNGAFSAGFAQSGYKGGTNEGPLPNLSTASKLPGQIGDGVVSLAGAATRMLDFRIQTLVQNHKARVLADPTVTVLDGQKATVKLIEKLKYVTKRDDAKNPTYEDEEVGPKLEVTPRIGRNGMITVSLSLATGEIVQWIKGGQGEQIPQTNSREVNTTIRVRDGEPFVIGGLFKETRSKAKASVPILSSIPLLGQLFQSRLDKKTRSQVVMILIPYILEVPDAVIRGKTL